MRAHSGDKTTISLVSESLRGSVTTTVAYDNDILRACVIGRWCVSSADTMQQRGTAMQVGMPFVAATLALGPCVRHTGLEPVKLLVRETIERQGILQ
jgi:hypothetical protein